MLAGLYKRKPYQLGLRLYNPLILNVCIMKYTYHSISKTLNTNVDFVHTLSCNKPTYFRQDNYTIYIRVHLKGFHVDANCSTQTLLRPLIRNIFHSHDYPLGEYYMHIIRYDIANLMFMVYAPYLAHIFKIHTRCG